jgi:tetratricopeptide (TPR) repeat protein
MIRASMKSITLETMIATLIIGMLMLASAPALAQDPDIEACTATSKNPETQIPACTRLLEREVRDSARRQAIALSNRAWAWKSKGELGRAVSDLTDAIGADPSFASAYVVRGDIYRERGQCDKAIADYDQVIRVLPEKAATYVARGVCWIRKQDYDRALADYEQVARLDPDNAKGAGAVAWSMKGRVHAMKGDLDAAIVDFGQAIRLDPQRAAFYNDRGSAWSSKRDYDRALADYDQALKLDPDNAKGVGAIAWNLKGALQSAKGDRDRAIAGYDEAIRLDPQRAIFYLDRGGVWVSKGDYDRATADYDQAIKLDPNLATAYSMRAKAYHTKGEYTRAIEDYDQTINLRPNDLDAYGGRGLARFYLGEFANAADDFMGAARGSSAYSMLWLYLSRARAGNGDAKEELTRGAERLNKAEWPYPVVELFLERQSLDAVQAAGGTPEQRCEVQFYVGEWHLLRGTHDAAAKSLQGAADTCPRNFVEYQAAVEELKRLKP